MSRLDPSRMRSAERLAELGEILAAGVQRLRARQGKAIPAAADDQDPLDVPGDVEASCAANSMEAAP